MRWCRLWVSALDDIKIQGLDGDTFKLWANLLLCAARHDDQGGTLPSAAQLAFWLRIPKEDITDALNTLTKAGLVDKDGPNYSIHDWRNWQPPSDKSTPRSRASRAKKRGGNGSGAQGCNYDATGVQRSRNGPAVQECNAGATPQTRIEQSRIETEERDPPTPEAGGHTDSPAASPPSPSPKSDEVLRVSARAERLFPMKEFGRRAEDACEQYPVAWVDAALQAASDTKGVDAHWTYVRGILRNYAAIGGPKPEVVKAAEKRTKPPPSEFIPTVPPPVADESAIEAAMKFFTPEDTAKSQKAWQRFLPKPRAN